MQQSHHVGMVGTTFRRAGQVGLSYYALPTPYHPAAAGTSLAQELAAATGVDECLYFATCNRVEVLFAARRGLATTTVRARMHAYFVARNSQLRGVSSPFDDAKGLHAYGQDGATERLFVIAAALDSMVPGEAQVLGQLKQAVAQAKEAGLVGPKLLPLAEAAFQAAKRVRDKTDLGQGRVSMLSLALEQIEARLAHASPAKPAQVCVVGVGDMAEQCASRFAHRAGIKLCFVNRTVERALPLARRTGATAVGLNDFLAQPVAADVLITATASQQPLFGGAFFAAMARAGEAAPLVVDLAVPPDVEPLAAHACGAQLWDIDRLATLSARHTAERKGAVAQARALLDASLEELSARQRERQTTGAIAAWRSHCQQVLGERLAQLPAELGSESLAVWARGLTNQLAHGPIQGLKAISRQDGGPEALAAFIRGAGLGDNRSTTP